LLVESNDDFWSNKTRMKSNEDLMGDIRLTPPLPRDFILVIVVVCAIIVIMVMYGYRRYEVTAKNVNSKFENVMGLEDLSDLPDGIFFIR
jgi:hypothetical protein